MPEIEAALDVLKSNGTSDITVLHCTTEYPAPFDEVNLNVMSTLKKEFGFPVGYSDHTKPDPGYNVILTAKKPSAIEMKNRLVARKSIVALRDIKAGEVFTAENLTTKRPGSGISPMRWNEIIGQTAKRDFSEDELIEI